MKSAIKNFHLPLPASLYDELRAAAVNAGRPTTKLAQEILKLGLEAHDRAVRRQEITSYAAETAGSSDDLDRALERASLAHLRTADR